MGSKNEPGQFDCYDNALPDEPMFILLARDPSAPDLVDNWAAERQRQIENCFRPKSDQAMVDEAVRCAAHMRHWRVVNNGAWRNSPVRSQEADPDALAAIGTAMVAGSFGNAKDLADETAGAKNFLDSLRASGYDVVFRSQEEVRPPKEGRWVSVDQLLALRGIAADIADPWPAIGPPETEVDKAVVEVRTKIAASIRAIDIPIPPITGHPQSQEATVTLAEVRRATIESLNINDALETILSKFTVRAKR